MIATLAVKSERVLGLDLERDTAVFGGRRMEL